MQAVVRACHAARRRRSSPAARAPASPAARCRSRTASSISLARMNRVLEVDLDGERDRRPAGRDEPRGDGGGRGRRLYYAPDPSSQQVCTIGGNVAENSGGAHCLKYGFTVNHVTGLVVVLPDGEVVRLGGSRSSRPGPTCSACSSARRGRSGSRPRSRCGCCARPEAVRHGARRLRLDRRRRRAPSPAIVGAGIVPVGDRDDGPADDRGGRGGGRTPATRTRTRSCSSSWTAPAPQVEEDLAAVEAICRDARRLGDPHRRRRRTSGRCSGRAASRRSRRWAGSRPTTTSRTASSRGRSCPRCCAGSPSSRREYGLRVGNVFHAGDGNLHPLVLYDGARRGRGRAGAASSPRRSSRRASTPAAR